MKIEKYSLEIQLTKEWIKGENTIRSLFLNYNLKTTHCALDSQLHKEWLHEIADPASHWRLLDLQKFMFI